MITKMEVGSFLSRRDIFPVIDVRAPVEFNQGHIPGAFNVPMFDDVERVIIGTIYQKSGRESAVFKGLEIIGPKLTTLVKKVQQVSHKKDILLHCWRGGMRSEHMGWLLSQAGFNVFILDGGYKSYRHYIRQAFAQKSKIVVLGGSTGSSKTELLHQLKIQGEQVLDLEKFAKHKGSVFGSLGQEPQPTNEQFENDLYEHWSSFDPGKLLWIEDESRSIGLVNIPEPLFMQMTKAPMIKIQIEREERIRRLVSEYALFPADELKKGFNKIAEKLGGTRIIHALSAIDRDDFATAVDLALVHYDQAYQYAISKRLNQDIHEIDFENDDPEKNAFMLKKIAEELYQTNHDFST